MEESLYYDDLLLSESGRCLPLKKRRILKEERLKKQESELMSSSGSTSSNNGGDDKIAALTLLAAARAMEEAVRSTGVPAESTQENQEQVGGGAVRHRVHHPPLLQPLPNGCHGRTSRGNSFCRRLPRYNGSLYCKLHYDQYVLQREDGGKMVEEELHHKIHDSNNTSPTGKSHAVKASNSSSGLPVKDLMKYSSHIPDKKYSGLPGEELCQATTTRGRTCTYVAVSGTAYCNLHSETNTKHSHAIREPQHPALDSSACSTTSSSDTSSNKGTSSEQDFVVVNLKSDDGHQEVGHVVNMLSNAFRLHDHSPTSGLSAIATAAASSPLLNAVPEPNSSSSSLSFLSSVAAVQPQQTVSSSILSSDPAAPQSIEFSSQPQPIPSMPPHTPSDPTIIPSNNSQKPRKTLPKLNSVESTTWLCKRVRIDEGPLSRHIGRVLRWGNGWVTLNTFVGLHNRRATELSLLPDNTHEDDAQQQQDYDEVYDIVRDVPETEWPDFSMEDTNNNNLGDVALHSQDNKTPSQINEQNHPTPKPLHDNTHMNPTTPASHSPQPQIEREPIPIVVSLHPPPPQSQQDQHSEEPQQAKQPQQPTPQQEKQPQEQPQQITPQQSQPPQEHSSQQITPQQSQPPQEQPSQQITPQQSQPPQEQSSQQITPQQSQPPQEQPQQITPQQEQPQQITPQQSQPPQEPLQQITQQDQQTEENNDQDHKMDSAEDTPDQDHKMDSAEDTPDQDHKMDSPPSTPQPNDTISNSSSPPSSTKQPQPTPPPSIHTKTPQTKNHQPTTLPSTHKKHDKFDELPKLGEILASFNNNGNTPPSRLALELFGKNTDLLFGTAALERGRRKKKCIERYEDTAMIERKKRRNHHQQDHCHRHESDEDVGGGTAHHHSPRHHHSPKHQHYHHDKKIKVLTSIDSDTWIGKRVHVLAGVMKGHKGIVTGICNGWVHVHIESNHPHKHSETSRRAYDLEILEEEEERKVASLDDHLHLHKMAKT